ncbi:MAG: TetR/AcrR family transcriptional regulator [Synergistales bacterium]|jgi:AcrR family transcriptional regulator|nr:TetR/AcrR family transcriptional regulator [Synergistales bacterium]
MARLVQKKKAVVEAMMRESLFVAARRLLEEEGWRGTTMERLAQEVGVSKGTVYNYFRDKREILCFVMERNTEELRHFVESIDLEEEDPGEILSRVLEEAFRGLYRNRRVIAAAVHAYHEDAELRREDFDFREDPLWEVRLCVRKVIARGVEAGSFRPVDPVLTEAVINAVTVGLARQFSLEMLDVPGDDFAASVKDLILQGLCPREDR